ncbi:RNI-like protein [Hypoxylon rubiginosum]|uniref:RNI-like protein n=1 Tax=Hypoxylon rubiginosum TaxID=110542 RepID=A0ACB9YQV7_9PEZI|nr:RNI-like protein [Hypoxylon rubiginosum]
MEPLMDSCSLLVVDPIHLSITNWNSSSNQPQDTPASNGSPKPATPTNTNGASPALQSAPSTESPAPVKPTSQRQGRTRSQSVEGSPGQIGTPPQRRGSWFSNISSKFSTSPANGHATPPAPTSESDTDDVAPLPKISPNKNAVLQHGSRQSGDAPYIPAPPRTNQPGLLGVFRRLSSSNGSIVPGTRTSHGLVERKVLNVDKHRERCRVNELCQAKLRRVAFCVDVEIAPMPRYVDEEPECTKPVDKTQKRKMSEKSEGEALKNPKALEAQKEAEGVVKATGEILPKEPEKEGTEVAKENPKGNDATGEEEPVREKETTRKKEKKKKSEAERKAKKEQKRKEALEKGAIPMELHLDTDSSTEDLPIPSDSPKTQSLPTTNPGRIYRRCCQLRETDILTKITLQLPKTIGSSTKGVVDKLDLTGYFMSLPDLVTLGDFLAVVPVREVILEDCGLTDEGVRVILAGLLAARKMNSRQRKIVTQPADLTQQGGVVERLVLKNNSKIGAEGWKHICLFIHMCRTIKYLDLSNLPFPAPVEPVKTPISHHLHNLGNHHAPAPVDLSLLLSKSIAERLAGPELELLNIGSVGLTTDQLGAVIDGVLKSGVTRLGLANNNLDAQGVQHVARYLRDAKCEGLDLGGNDLRENLPEIAAAFGETDELWALSLANCNLKPASLCKLFPKLVKLRSFKFLDLSHNRALFESEPSAIGLLRKYLPQMDSLRRLHLADVSLSSEHTISLAEILPEVKTLAHLNLLENADLVKLADAKTEEGQEEACALYASLLAAARVSPALVKIDIDNPSADSGEVVKALANRVVVYCMRNLQGVPDIRDSTGEDGQKLDKLPDVLRHLVGHEEDYPLVDEDDDSEPAPDEDYVIGGTGVVKALACVLKNRGDDSRRHSGEFTRDLETGTAMPRAHLPPGKVKDMSRYLLLSARKIRARLQPALAMAKASSNEDIHNYHRLVFLDQTIEGIIKRFEDEFPETRELEAIVPDTPPAAEPELSASISSLEADAGLLSDTEDIETEVRSPASRSRSNSIISHTSKALAEEEGRALRVGHRFRRGLIKQEHFDLLTGSEEIRNDPDHIKLIVGLMDELFEKDEPVQKDIKELGPVCAFQKHREEIVKRLRDEDPAYWESFVEAQEKARANVQVATTETTKPVVQQESAIIDDEDAVADD